jgi:ClpP class serine protease
LDDSPGPKKFIGKVFIRGSIKNDIRPAVDCVLDSLHMFDGLLLVFDCRGGAGLAARMLMGMVVIAGATIPVVGYAEGRACSAALFPLAASEAAFANPYAALGVFGCTNPYCDGRTPGALVSTQSPKKPPPIDWPQRKYIAPDKLPGLQAETDAAYEEDLVLIARNVGLDRERLRPYLDGRLLGPQEAQKAGLISGVCSQDQALENLRQLIRTKDERKAA